MSVSGISSNQNSYLLYMLQQQNQNTANASSDGGFSAQDILTSGQGLTIDYGANDESQDGTYASSGMNAGDPQQPDTFLSDLQSLLQATQSGDATSAQTAATSVENDLGLPTSASAQSSSASGDTDTSSAPSSGSQFLTDLKSLLSAVKSGDMTTAQSDAGTLQNDLQAMAPPPPPSDDSAGTSNSNSLNSFMSDLSDLPQSTSSGDSSTAKTAASKVESDLEALGQSSNTNSTSTTASASSSSASSSATSTDSSSSTDTTMEQIMQALAAAIANMQQQAAAASEPQTQT